MQRLLAPREAANILGISYPTLKQWIYNGKLKTAKTPGGHHRVPESEIDRLIPKKLERGDIYPSPRQFPQSLRPQSACRPRCSHQIRWPVGASHHVHRRTAHHRDHHRRRRQRDAPESWRTRCGAHQVHGSHDSSGMKRTVNDPLVLDKRHRSLHRGAVLSALCACHSRVSVRLPHDLRPKLRIAAAADLQFAMKDLAARYESQSGIPRHFVRLQWKFLHADRKWRAL